MSYKVIELDLNVFKCLCKRCNPGCWLINGIIVDIFTSTVWLKDKSDES